MLLRVGRILLRRLRLLLLLRLRVLRVFGRHLGLLVLVLQKRIEVVFVVLVRWCKVHGGPVLCVPLSPLLRASHTLLVLLPELELARIALAHRHAPSDLCRFGAIFFLVAC